MAKNAEYSYVNMTDAEKKVFEQSIKDDYYKLLQIQLKRSNNGISQRYEDECGYRKIDENRLEELANVYSEIKDGSIKLAEHIRTLAGLMVIDSGNFFLKQKRIRKMHEKYPDDCSLGEMWSVFIKCFDSFNKDYISLNKQSCDFDEGNETNNRFIAYFKSSLYSSFINIYNRKEDKIVLRKDDNGDKVYGTAISVDQDLENEEGETSYIQIEDQTDYISSYDTIDAKVYLFSNLITNIMDHLGTDKRKANDAIKRMFRAFYTGDTIFFAKCEGLDTFYQSMCRSQKKILASCLDDFFDFILSCDTPKSIEQVKHSRIKKYKEFNNVAFVNKNPEESPILYIPTAENNKKRFGFENLVYDAFSNKTNITEQIKKYDDFRNKYFFKCER